MDHITCIKDMFESIEDYRKTDIEDYRCRRLLFLIENDSDLLKEYGFFKSDVNSLSLEMKKKLLEQNEDYLHHIKNEEESIFEKNLNK